MVDWLATTEQDADDLPLGEVAPGLRLEKREAEITATFPCCQQRADLVPLDEVSALYGSHLPACDEALRSRMKLTGWYELEVRGSDSRRFLVIGEIRAPGLEATKARHPRKPWRSLLVPHAEGVWEAALLRRP